MDEQQVTGQEINQSAQSNIPVSSAEPISQPPIETPPQSRGKPNKLVLAVIVLLLLAGAAFGGYMMGKQNTPTPSPTPVVTSTPSSEPTSGWETYTNGELGFSIKHPREQYLIEEFNDEDNRLVVFSGDTENEGPIFEVRTKSLSDVISNPQMFEFNQYYYLDTQKTETTEVDGRQTNVYKSKTGYCDATGCSRPYVSYAVLNDDIYHITFFGDDEVSQEENQILSSFEFIEDGTPTPTSSPSASQ